MPTSVRPQAREALREIGIDISGQRSKGMEEVDRPVDVVITLCAEEACPVWLGDAVRMHWPLPDPGAVEGGEAVKLDAFRRARDELWRRLEVFFGA
jgi:arsenate reductase